MKAEASTDIIKSYIAQRQWEKVIKICKETLEDNPSHTEIYHFWGKALVGLGKLKEAIEIYQKLLENNLDRAEIHAEIGLLYSKDRQLDKALQHYQRGLKLKPDWTNLQYNLAVVCHQLEDWEQAITGYEKTIALAPNHTAAHFNLGVLYTQREELEKAIASYQQVIKLQPNNTQAYSNLGSVFVKQEKFAAAIDYFQQGLKFDPTWATLHNNLGQVFLLNQQPEKALARFENAVILEPTMALAHYNLGKLWKQQRNYSAAIDCFQQVINLEPNNIAAYSHCADALFLHNDLELTIDYLRSAISIQPHFVEAYCQRAKSLQPETLLEQAKISCANFLIAIREQRSYQQILNHFWKTYFYWGEVLFTYGGIKEAQVCYQKALQIKPDEVNLYLHLGDCLAKQQKLDPAITIYHMGLILQPDHPQICFQLGKVLEQQQKLDRAISYYEKAWQEQKENAESHWQHLPNFFLSDEQLLKLPQGTYPRTIDWVRDSELEDFEYFHLDWSLEEMTSIPSSRKAVEPKSTKPKQSLLVSPHAAVKSKCGGVNCSICMKNLINYFEPVHIGKQAYKCLFTKTPPVISPSPFVVNISAGKAWIAPQKNSWLICNAIAIITPDNYLLGDLSRYYPWYLPGCSEPEKTEHTIFSLENIPPLEKIPGKVAILSGLAGHVYYHWMIDILPRLDILRRSGIDLEIIDWFVVNNIDRNFQKETLDFLGIPLDKIKISDRHSYIEADELIVPSFPGHLDWVPKSTITFLRKAFLPAIDRQRDKYPQRIYISRSQARGRIVINEDAVIELLSEFEFTTIWLEELSVLEQVALFANTKVIVSPHGSSLTNIVFCRPGSTIIELFSPNYLRTDYWMLSHQLKLQHYYSVGENFSCFPLRNLMYQNPLTEDILVNLNSLRQILKLADIQ